MEQVTYNLTELAESSGLSQRTIRYYIAQGVLDGAIKSGQNSYYLPAHLERLKEIRRLKDQGLSLEQIRVTFGVIPPTLPQTGGLRLVRLMAAPDVEVTIRADMPELRRKKVEAALKEFSRAVSETTDTQQENSDE